MTRAGVSPIVLFGALSKPIIQVNKQRDNVLDKRMLYAWSLMDHAY